jgi:transcriptional regulator with XRE-family HTH domain
VEPAVAQVRAEMREIIRRTGLSMRQLSLTLGRDAGYVAALLDETRPSRATPTPADLQRLSDRTGIPLVHLLERFWGIPPRRLADDLEQLSVKFDGDKRLGELSDGELGEVLDFAGYLIAKRDGVHEQG